MPQTEDANVEARAARRQAGFDYRSIIAYRQVLSGPVIFPDMAFDAFGPFHRSADAAV